MKKIILLFLCCTLTLPCFAKSIAYDIGTTGYMLREAEQAKAPKYAPEEYKLAVLNQQWAKQALRGTYVMKTGKTSKKIRSKTKAKEFTQTAYVLAKTARDKGLKALGKRF